MIDEPVLERRPIGLLRDNAHSERAAENAIRDSSARCLARKALHLPVRGLECSVLQSAFVLPFRQNGQLRGWPPVCRTDRDRRRTILWWAVGNTPASFGSFLLGSFSSAVFAHCQFHSTIVAAFRAEDASLGPSPPDWTEQIATIRAGNYGRPVNR